VPLGAGSPNSTLPCSHPVVRLCTSTKHKQARCRAAQRQEATEQARARRALEDAQADKEEAEDRRRLREEVERRLKSEEERERSDADHFRLLQQLEEEAKLIQKSKALK
jgi:hypothetical protein